MLTLGRTALVLVAFTSALLACSSGSGGGVGGDPIPRDQVGRKLVERVCAAIKSCCAQNGFTAEHERCLQNADKLQASFDAELAKNPGLVYDSARAGNCISKWGAALGTCTPRTSGFDPDDDPDCRNLYRGTKAPGAPCEDSDECANGGLCHRFGSGTTAGTCIARKPPAAGDPCLTDEVADPAKVYGTCNGGSDGFYCDAASKTCKAAGGVGTQCMSDGTTPISTTGSDVCDASSYCSFETKKCEPRPRAGESCASSGAICADGTYCEQQSKTCSAKKPAGADCGAAGSGGGECQHLCDSQTKKCLPNGIPRDICSGEDFD